MEGASVSVKCIQDESSSMRLLCTDLGEFLGGFITTTKRQVKTNCSHADGKLQPKVNLPTDCNLKKRKKKKKQ